MCIARRKTRLFRANLTIITTDQDPNLALPVVNTEHRRPPSLALPVRYQAIPNLMLKSSLPERHDPPRILPWASRHRSRHLDNIRVAGIWERPVSFPTVTALFKSPRNLMVLPRNRSLMQRVFLDSKPRLFLMPLSRRPHHCPHRSLTRPLDFRANLPARWMRVQSQHAK